MILGGGFLRFTSLGAFANKLKEINKSIIIRIFLYFQKFDHETNSFVPSLVE
jgi:hypothetical protein